MNYIDQIINEEQITDLRKKSHEEMLAFFVKTDGEDTVLLGSTLLGVGTATNVAVSKEMFDDAIKTSKNLKADGIVLLHNHPKSIFNILLKPSDGDLTFTMMFHCTAKGHKVKFLDHIIIDAGKGYYSFKENDLL